MHEMNDWSSQRHTYVTRNPINSIREIKAWVGNSDRTVGTPIVADSFKLHPDFNPYGCEPASSLTSPALPSSTSDFRFFFLNSGNTLNGNNIALIRLPTPLAFDQNIQPICYPSFDVLDASVAGCDKKIYGWGAIDFLDSVLPDTLQKLNVTVTANPSHCSGHVDGKIVCVEMPAAYAGPSFDNVSACSELPLPQR